MDGIQMEPIGKYKADRNGSAKAAAWRNMVDQDLDDVAFLADTDKAREARELGEVPVAVCSQRRALCLAALVFAAMFATALIVVYATPQPECPCLDDSSLLPGQPPTGSDENATAANKERIASNGVVYPWRGARLPTFLIPKHYNLWLHPNLTTGELRGEVSIDFKVDRDTSFVVVNVRDMNVTERALFRGGGALGPKVLRTLDYPPADQTYIEFKEKLRRKYNYTLSLRFITKLDRSDKQRGFFLAGTHRHRCAVTRFWLTHARSAFPALDEPHLRATFKLTVVRDRFHVSLTNMPIVATEEAGFYLGHRLLQDEFATTPPMSPHMVALAVCRLQRRSAPPLATTPALPPHTAPPTAPPTTPPAHTGSTEPPVEDDLPPPEISLYSDQQVILDESGPLLEWVSKTIQLFAYELNTSYPLPKFDIVVVEGGGQYSEGWGLITLSPAVLTDTKVIARLLALQVTDRSGSKDYYRHRGGGGRRSVLGGVGADHAVAGRAHRHQGHRAPTRAAVVRWSGIPRWWSSQWLLEALTSVLGERAPALNGAKPERQQDTLLVDHILPALRLDSSNSVRAVASPRLERADIEAAADELSLHKGAAIVSMAIEAAGQAAGRAALARLLRLHRAASADARDLWRALQADGTDEAPSHAWDGWCEKPGYPLLCARTQGDDVVVKQERFVMSADAPDPEPSMMNGLLTQQLRAELNELFYEPENITEAIEEDINATTTATPPTTRRTTVRTTRPPPAPRWIIPVTFTVGPPEAEDEDIENITRGWKNSTENMQSGTWYDVGSETKLKTSKWLENVTYLIWMNDTEMVIPELGKHKWVRYNVGARGLYRVAPQDQKPGESEEAMARRAAALYDSGAPAERALLLDDAFVLSRARRLPASRAVAAASRLRDEKHWAVWRVLLSHAGAWRSLLHTAACAPALRRMLAELPPPVPVYTMQQLQDPAISEDQQWLSGALLTAGVEWENENVTEQALALFDAWLTGNDSIPEIYQEAAFTAGVRRHGEAAWSACWRALLASHAAPRPLYSHRALLAALSSPQDDWLLYRFAYTVLSPEASRGHEWRTWAAALVGGACRWRGAGGVWRLLAGSPALPPAALLAAARCMHQPADYYRFKEVFGEQRGAAAALDTIALNAAWVPQADADLLRYFNAVNRRTRD